MPGGGWSCPHELNGLCGKFSDKSCDPGMKGCELYGRYVFFDASKNTRLEQKRDRETLRNNGTKESTACD